MCSLCDATLNPSRGKIYVDRVAVEAHVSGNGCGAEDAWKKFRDVSHPIQERTERGVACRSSINGEDQQGLRTGDSAGTELSNRLDERPKWLY